VYANSIVAVDAKTGKYMWHFQTVHHDLVGHRHASAGALFDFVQNGTRVAAIAQVVAVLLESDRARKLST